jgi:hypothetical protein
MKPPGKKDRESLIRLGADLKGNECRNTRFAASLLRMRHGVPRAKRLIEVWRKQRFKKGVVQTYNRFENFARIIL